MPNIPDNELLMTMQEVCAYLKVTRYTIYRLIKEGQLPAIRVGGQWRFRKAQVEYYLSQKKFRYGFTGLDHCYFLSEVLSKYRKETDKYYLREQAFDGCVGSKQEYLDLRSGKNKDKPAKGYKPFVDIHYRKVAVTGGYVILLTPKQYENLPPEEQKHWMGFWVRKL